MTIPIWTVITFTIIWFMAGFFACAILTMGKMSDYQDEIERLKK